MIRVIHGVANPQFEKVTQVFSDQLNQLGGGAALCIYWQGEAVLDIWSGFRDEYNNPWTKNIGCMSYSTSKGVLATLLHIAMEEAGISYDTRIAKIWPSFKQNFKDKLTIKDALCHQTGLADLSRIIESESDIFDWDQMIWSIAKTASSHDQVNRSAYHAMTFGWIIGEIIHRLTGMKPSQMLEYTLKPIMGRQNYFSVPQRHLQNTAQILKKPPQSLNETWYRNLRSHLGRTLKNKVNLQTKNIINRSARVTGSIWPLIDTIGTVDVNSRAFLQAEIPAINGVFTARGLASLYSMLLTGHFEDKQYLSAQRVKLIGKVQNRDSDLIIRIPMHWRLGYQRVLNTKRQVPNGFGHLGFGGSGAFCDRDRSLAVGFVNNSLWASPLSDTRFAHLAGTILATCDHLIKK